MQLLCSAPKFAVRYELPATKRREARPCTRRDSGKHGSESDESGGIELQSVL